MENVSQLQPAFTPQVQITSIQASEKDADFLALRLVNKRARLRLSPEPFDLAAFPGKVSLFATVNSKGWFAAVVRDASGASALILSLLSDLRSALIVASDEDVEPFRPQRRVPIGGAPPHILTFACNDTRLLLGLLDGSIHVYSSEQLFSSGEGPVQPAHVFPSSSAPILSIQPNPGDIPELIAVLRNCRNGPGSLAVELLDVQKSISSGGWMAGDSPSTTPTSISWSPKGKQLALGLQSGDIVTFSPTATATPKSSIPRPPSANNMSVISVHWLSTTSFHTIYAPQGQLTPDVEQIHFHASLDSKSNSAQNIRFDDPYLPYPGLRPPGEFLVCLRGWDPSKVLLFVGDSTSSDIGLIGSMASDAGESWHNLSLEETSTPSLPLDKDQNDTILLGMDVDLTSTKSYRHSTASGETLELPAHPIMYVYASDGTVLGWHVLNVSGASYSGMVTGVDTSISVPSVPSSMVRELSSDMQTTPSISPTAPTPMETSTTQTSSTSFGQTSVPGPQSSAFGTPGPVFGQSSPFDQAQSGFGQQPTSAFGKSSTLGQPVTMSGFGSTTAPLTFGQSSAPTFGSTVSGGGFTAFSSAGPAKFGQASFGFAGSSQTTTSTLAPSTSVPEESMGSDDSPSLGGFGLGAEISQELDSKPSIFGNSSATVPSGPQTNDSGLIKPGTGFGAFAGFDQTSPFAKPSAFTTTQQSTVSFGANAFQSSSDGAHSTSSFSAFGTGQSAFGKGPPTSAFGQPSFGQSSFGQFQTGASVFGKSSLGAVTSTAQPTAPSVGTSTSGGFSAFATDTKSAFGVAASKNVSAKPVWATSDSSRSVDSSSTRAATNVVEKPTELPSETTFSVIPSKTVDTSTTLSTGSAFTMPSQFMPRDAIARDDDSRSPSPAPVQQKETTSSISPISSPTPSMSAFSNLQTTPSFVKPASGIFGELPKESPFFAPPKSPVSAFALSATPTPSTTPPKTSLAQPTFGASSMPGGAIKSAFPPATTTPAQPPPISLGGEAFSAFSNSGSGFSAFSSGGNKSFSELLRSAGEVKSSKAPEPSPSEVTPTKPAQPPVQPAVSTTPVTAPAKEPPEPSSTPLVAPKVEKDVPVTAIEVKTAEVEVPGETKEKPKEAIPVQEPSLESISSSTTSSFVKVEEEEGEIGEGETFEVEPGLSSSDVSSESDVSEEEEEEEDAEHEDEQEEEEEEEELEEESEVTSEVVNEEKTEERVQEEIDPAEIPLPVTPAYTRSPSTTPKAEHPKIAVSVSPLPQAPSVPRVSPVRERSTTPPESPVKETPSTPAQSQTPPPKPSPPPSSPFGLVPRPNNRPLRSSPLASTPLVLDGETEKPPPAPKSAGMVPQPAPPKTPFGQWTPPPPPSTASAEAKISPFLSLSSTPEEMPVPVPTSAFTITTSTPTHSLFAPVATTATATITTTTAPGVPSTLFSVPATLPAFPSGSVTPSSWGTPPLRPADVAPVPTKMLFGGQPSVFRVGQAMPLSSTPSPFGSMGPSIVPSPSPTPPLPPKVPSPVPAPVQPPTPTPEQGMQAECSNLLVTVVRELESLKQLAIAASIKTAELKRTSGIPHQKGDLGDPRKWEFGDIEEYGRVLVDIQVDVKELKLERVSLRKVLKELDSNMLKVNTRKEEIARYNKAKTDAEFAKMLKVRTLAPEYLETQSQLRKSIRVIKDRVQKLEDHLQASKKKINELRTGRPSIRPPSLDTVNRTFRNIDITIDQQKQDISQLRHRLAKLEISGGMGARDQVVMSSSKRPPNVTPNVAVTAAAALNAERSARRLKKMLLASRKQPLLNTTATASPLPPSFQTPQKGPSVRQDLDTNATTSDVNVEEGASAFASPSTLMMSFPSSMPGWTPPPPSVFVSPASAMCATHDISPSRNRGSTKHHQRPIVLKKHINQLSGRVGGAGASTTMATGTTAATTTTTMTTQPSPTPTFSSFEWRPVEPIRAASSLPFAIRPAGSG